MLTYFGLCHCTLFQEYNVLVFLWWAGLNDVQRLRMTSHIRLTSTQNRSRFPQAYARYFLHCNKHFAHMFFNMVCLELRDLAAEQE